MTAIECACGDTHMSILAAVYCQEQIEADDKASRRDPKPRRDTGLTRAYELGYD